MNERIREPYYSLMYKASEGWNDHLFQVPPELLEKFAQLIVRECAKVILETPVKYTEIDIMHIIRDNVKEHFGVEE